MVDVGIQETTATTGTGTLTLTAATGFVRVSNSFSVGDAVSTCITSGNGDKEWGICEVGAGNTLLRILVNATLVGSTYSTANTKISLTGTSTVIVTQNTKTASGGQMIVNAALDYNQCPYIPINTALSAVTLVAGRVYAIPWSVSSPITWDRMGFIVETAAGAGNTARVSVCKSSWDSIGAIRVGREIADSGDLSTASTGDKIATITPFSPVPGTIYWSVFFFTAAPRLRAPGNNSAASSIGYPFASPFARTMLEFASPIPSVPLADYSALVLGDSTVTCPVAIFRPKIT